MMFITPPLLIHTTLTTATVKHVTLNISPIKFIESMIFPSCTQAKNKHQYFTYYVTLVSDRQLLGLPVLHFYTRAPIVSVFRFQCWVGSTTETLVLAGQVTSAR